MNEARRVPHRLGPVSVALVAATACALGPATFADDLSAQLELFAGSMRSNYEKLETWKGRYSFDDYHLYQDAQAAEFLSTHLPDTPPTEASFLKNSHGVFDFAVDARSGRLFVDFRELTPAEFTWKTSGQPLPTAMIPFHRRSILTSDRYTYFEPEMHYTQPKNVPNSDGGVKRTAFRVNARDGEDQGSGIVPNPLDTFGPPGARVWDVFEKVAETLRTTGKWDVLGNRIQIEEVTTEAGERNFYVTIPFLLRDDLVAFQHYFLDPAHSFMPTEKRFTAGQGGRDTRLNVTYVKEAGVSVPSTIRWATFTDLPGEVSFARYMSLEEQAINQSIPEFTFEYRNLGMENGDRLIDAFDRKEYLFENGVLSESSGRALIQEMGRLILDHPLSILADIETPAPPQGMTPTRPDTNLAYPVGAPDEANRSSFYFILFWISSGLAMLLAFLHFRSRLLPIKR